MKRVVSILAALVLTLALCVTLTSLPSMKASAAVLATTATLVDCFPSTLIANQHSTCTATVTDNTAVPIAPTGAVTFTPGGGSCTLTGAGSSVSCSLDVIPTEAGSVTVTATYAGDTNHAASTGSTTLTVLQPLAVTLQCDQPTAQAFTCTAVPSGGTLPYSAYYWNLDGNSQGYSNVPTFTIVVATSGSHNIGVVVYDSNSVTAEATAKVDARPLTVVVSCEQPYASAFTCSATPLDGKEPYYFQWTVDGAIYSYYSQPSTFNIVLSTAGTHTVGVTTQDSNGVTSSEATVTVVARPLIVTVVCDQPFASAFTCTAASSDGKEPFYFQWTVDGTIYSYYAQSSTFSVVLASGTHTFGVTAQDSNGVTSTEASVTMVTRPLLATVACLQPFASEFTCNATPSDGREPYYFRWTVDSVIYRNYDTPSTFSTVFSTTGTHVIGVTAQDSNGVTSIEATVTVEARALLVTVACDQPTASAFTCNAASSDGKEPYYFQWKVDGSVYRNYDTSSTFGIVLPSGTTHTIGVTVQDSNGVVTKETTVVVDPRPLMVTLACDQPIASAFTCNATPSDEKSPSTFYWYVDGTNQGYTTDGKFSTIVRPSGSHTIGVTVYDSNGISAQASVTVEARALLVTASCDQPTASAFVCSAAPSDGSEPYTFYWTIDGSSQGYTYTGTFSPVLSTGTHIIGVTVYDSNSVNSAEVTVIVEARPLPVTSTCDQPTASAFVCTASVSDGREPYYFYWYVDSSNYQNSYASTFDTVLSTGTHIIGVIAYDSNGVSNKATISVEATPLLLSLRCDQPSSSLFSCTATPSGGKEPYYFNWFVDDSYYQNSYSSVFSATLSTGTHNIKVAAYDAKGVSQSAETSVTAYSLELSVTLACGPAIRDNPVTCDATISGGIEPYNYEWTLDGALQADAGSSFTRTFPDDGRHTIEVRVTDSTTPTALFNVASKNLIVAAQPLTVTITCGTALVGDPLRCDASATGGIPPYTFTWTVDGGLYAYTAVPSFTTSFSVKGPHVIGVKATDFVNTISSETTTNVNIEPFDYNISITPTETTVTLGSHTSVTTTITITVTQTTPGIKPVGLSFFSYQCYYYGCGITAEFSQPTITPTTTGAVSNITLTVNSNTPPGVYTFTISAYPQGDTPADEMVTYTLTVEPSPIFDFDVSISPTSATVVQGHGTTDYVSITLTSGVAESVDLSVTGFPAGVDVLLATPSGTPSFSSQMEMTSTRIVPVGTYTITITATGGGLGKTATFTLTIVEVFDYNISITPASNTVILGSHTDATATVTITITQTTLGAQPVTLSLYSNQCSGYIPYYWYCGGISPEFSPATVTPTGTGAVSVLTLTLSPGASPGVYTFTISAFPQGETSEDESVTYTLTVEPSPIFDFDLSVYPASATIEQGRGTTPQVSVTLTSGTAVTVELSASGLPDGAGLVFTTSSGDPSYSTPMTISTLSTTPAETYTITVTATGGGLTRTATFTIMVIQVFDYSLSITPAADTVANGPTSQPITIAVTVIQTAPGVKPVDLSIFSYQCYYNYCGITAEFSETTVTPTATGAVSVLTLHASGVTPGVYFFTISASPQGDTPTDETATYTLTVIAGQPVAVTLSCGTAIAGASISCYASATDGTPPYSYQWKIDGQTVGDTASSVTRTFDVRGTHVFGVIVTDANQVSTSEVTATATITPRELTIIVGCGTGTIFVGEPFSCVALVSGGTTPYSFTWTVDGREQAGETSSSLVLTLDSLGAHTISANVTDIDNVSTSSSTTATPIIMVVGVRTTSTTVSCVPSSVDVGAATACMVTVTDNSVSPTTPTGTVTPSTSGSGGFTFSSCGAISGSCSFDYTPSAVGTDTHTITASYGGDSTHDVSMGKFDLTVTDAPPACSISGVSPNPATTSQQVTLSFSCSDSDGTVTSISVDWGDGSTADSLSGSATSDTHTYSSATGSPFTITVTATDNAGLTGHATISETVTSPVLPATTTSVSCNPSTVDVGIATICTATVTDNSVSPTTPSGTVSFSSGGSGTFTGTPAGTCTLSSGTCSVDFTPSSPTNAIGGPELISGIYNGDSTHATSSGFSFLSVTNPIDTTSTSVTCSPSPVNVGVATTCTATVTNVSGTTPATPSGTVTFGSTGSGTFTGTPAGTCTLSSGTCSVDYIPSAITNAIGGPQHIMANYGGDSTHYDSFGVFDLPVTSPLHATSTSVSCPPNNANVGVASTCTVTVTDTSATPTTPSGSVTFGSSGSGTFTGTPAGTCTLSSGSCSLDYTPSAVGTGTHTITALYGGDPTHDVSQGTLDATVTASSTLHNTTTTVTCDSPVVVNQVSNCTATVTDADASPTTPTGIVNFSSDSSGEFSNAGACTLSSATAGSGSCTLTYTPNTVGSGTHTITASYAGDSTHDPSTNQTAVTVNRRATSTTIVGCTPASLTFGSATICTALVNDTDIEPGIIPTGAVTFTSSGTGTFSGSPCTVSQPVATCQVTYTPTGTTARSDTITARYSGDASHDTSAATFPVNAETTPLDTTTATVSCTPNPVTIGQSSKCTVTVTDTSSSDATTPTGTVGFTTNSTGKFAPTSATCTLAAGTTAGSAGCSLSYAPTVTGHHLITGSYSGDLTHSGSTADFSLAVTFAGSRLHSTKTVVNCSQGSVLVNAALTCTVRVVDNSKNPTVPTGMVTFTTNATGTFSPAASCKLVAGNAPHTATCSVSYTPTVTGKQLITGSYSGDSSHTKSFGGFTVNIRSPRTGFALPKFKVAGVVDDFDSHDGRL